MKTMENKSKQLKRDILLAKPTDCKHCQGISASIFTNYRCVNPKSKFYMHEPLICDKDCCPEYEV